MTPGLLLPRNTDCDAVCPGQLIFFPPSNQGGNKPRYRSRIHHLTSRAPNLLFSCSMKIGRIILALMIAVSVAVLPAASGVGPVMKSTDTAADMAAIDGMDCCPHKVNPCDKAMDGCASMVACALTWLTFSDAASSPVIFPLHLAQLNPALGTTPLNPQAGSPPFRPPRV